MDILSNLGLAFLFGALGGLGFGLLQDKGLELPATVIEADRKSWDLGFIEHIIIGALAGVLTYSLSQPTDQLSIIAATLPAGIGGTAILRSYVNGQGASALKAVTENAINVNENIARMFDVVGGVAAGGRGVTDAMVAPLDNAEIALIQEQVAGLRQDYERVIRRWRIK